MQISGVTVARNGRVEVFGPLQVASAFGVQSAIASQCAGNLANAVGAKIETDAGVVIANRCCGAGALARVPGIGANKWHDKFVGDAFVVRLFHSLYWIAVLPSFSFAEHHRAIGFGDAVPAAIAA